MPNELAMEDVVDDVVIRAYREHVRHPRLRPSESRLLRLAKPVPEAERIVEHARAFLRQRLLETGCVLEAAQS